MRCRKLFAGLLAAAALVACGREEPTTRSSEIRISLIAPTGNSAARIVVVGVDAENLKALRSAPQTGAPWDSLFRVTVAANVPAVAGRYAATDSTVEFQPLFPLDAGRDYWVKFDPKRLPVPRLDSVVTAIVLIPKPEQAPSTTVSRILPTNTEVPENQLRLYIEFSAPMSRQPGLEFVHLIDDNGKEVQNAFLPLDADFWNPDHTRYTLFLDPGRVKRGILPNEQMGRPLKAGRAYALVIDSTWRDANGLPLVRRFRHEFRAGPAFEQGIDLKTWRITPPKSGTRDTLVVTFARSLDHGLLQRSIGVERGGQLVRGEGIIGQAELQWRFVPNAPWQAGEHRLVVLSILEDVAGNRVGRPFEVDMFERADSTAAPERHTIPFRPR